MSIYASTGGLGDIETVGPPWLYRGSHILPAHGDPRGGRIDLAVIPSHITRDGRDDQPEDGRPWPWLRLSIDVPGDDPTVILNPAQARELRDQLDRWLNTQGAAVTDLARDPRRDLLDAIDFNYTIGVLGYDNPEQLVAAFEDTVADTLRQRLDIGEEEAWCKICRRVWDGPRHRCESDAEQRLDRLRSLAEEWQSTMRPGEIHPAAHQIFNTIDRPGSAASCSDSRAESELNNPGEQQKQRADQAEVEVRRLRAAILNEQAATQATERL